MRLNEIEDQPYIEAHLSGPEVLWIDMMWVPPNQRGKGVGRRYYQEWEKTIPKTVKLIRLMAADTGEGLSNGFWESLGFDYVYDGEEAEQLDYESQQQMWKGVNGHPTPESIQPDETQ